MLPSNLSIHYTERFCDSAVGEDNVSYREIVYKMIEWMDGRGSDVFLVQSKFKRLETPECWFEMRLHRLRNPNDPETPPFGFRITSNWQTWHYNEAGIEHDYPHNCPHGYECNADNVADIVVCVIRNFIRIFLRKNMPGLKIKNEKLQLYCYRVFDPAEEQKHFTKSLAARAAQLANGQQSGRVDAVGDAASGPDVGTARTADGPSEAERRDVTTGTDQAEASSSVDSGEICVSDHKASGPQA